MLSSRPDGYHRKSTSPPRVSKKRRHRDGAPFFGARILLSSYLYLLTLNSDWILI